MTTFFQAQMDYIFFFYGLAFIGLGVVAYILAKEANQRLPWGWLALFGFIHGVNEWLDLVALVGGDGVRFAALRWVIMTASFLCLVEFGRLSLTQRRGRGPGRWLLVVLALAAGLGAVWGWSGLNATSRYFLGLVGSLGAGWALVAEANRADSRCRPSLLAGGAGFILYGLATGLVVPQAGFFPANTLNYATFTSLTGLPIQLVRGLLAVWIAAMSVGYFQLAPSEGYEPCYRYRVRYLGVVVAALVLILAGGWFLTQSLGNMAWQEVRKTSRTHNQLAIQRLTFEIEQAEEAVKAMSGSPWISPALGSGSRQTLAQANAVLDRYQQRFGAAVAYLMDASGATIASSNRSDPDSFVGKNYAFRPYFQEAMTGNVGRYFALGVTSKKRGYYASHPVKDPAGKSLGVAVFKITLNRFQQELGQFDPAFLIDPRGIVFVASRPDLDYHSLWPVTAGDPADFKAQYGTDRFTPIFAQPLVDEARVDFAGKSYVVTREHIYGAIAPGWTLVNLDPLTPVVHYRLMGIAAAFTLVLLTLVFAGANLSLREGANRIMASEARFRTMFAAAPEAVFVFDPESRRILDANPFMAQWLGYGPEEIVGLEIDQILAPEPLEAVAARAGECPDSQAGHEARRYRKKDGSRVDVECTEADIAHGDQTRKILFVRDITERKQAEVELKKERDFIATLLDTIGALVVVLDSQGHIVRFNRACEQVSGYSQEEVENKKIWDFLIPPEEVGTVQKVFGALLTDFVPGNNENYWVSRDGQRRLIAWSNTSMREAGGSVTHVIGTGIDVTARRQAENEVREAKEYLENILENSADPIGIVDQRGRFITWNKAAEQAFGYSLDEIKGKPSSELYADQNELEAILAQLRRDVSVRGYEVQLKKKDGGIALFALSISLLFDRHHEVIGSVCVARDLSEIKKALDELATVNQQLQHEITERKLSEDALSKNYDELQETMQRLEYSKNMLQLIIESVPARVFWKDSDLRYLGCNTLFARDAGLSDPQQLLGKDDFSMGWKEQAELYRADDRQVMESRRPKINIPEPQTTPAGAKIWLNTSKVPLQMPNGEVFGVLGVYEDITERRLGEEALQNANAQLQVLVAQVEERNRTMTLANEMADMLQACQASEEAYKAIGHFMPRLFPDDAGALYMLNNSRNLFEPVASWGQDQLAVPVFAPDECWSVRRGRLHKVEDPREALCCPHVAQAFPGGYLCVPLIAQGETLGVLHLRPGPPAAGQTPELTAVKDQLALTVAEDLALALANLRLRETLRSQAIRDPLTGLFNRRYLEETMERELNRVKRQGIPLGVIMMDLDHFKQYNDAFGHSAGDELLSALGTLLKTHIRGEDIACRYGGEEFLLILPGASMKIALERAENLRLAVKEMHQHYQGLKPASLSLGVAVYPHHGNTGPQLIQSADAALYRAKRAGRDRVVAAEYAEATVIGAPPASPLRQAEIS